MALRAKIRWTEDGGASVHHKDIDVDDAVRRDSNVSFLVDCTITYYLQDDNRPNVTLREVDISRITKEDVK